MKTIKLLFLTLLTSSFIVSCSDDDTPQQINEEEVITTMTVTLIPQGGGTTVTLQTRDLDGDGPTQPVITVSGPFAAGVVYNGSIEFLNELENPAEDITEEVEEEDDEHQVFYTLGNGIGTVAYTDMDDDGNPVGLTFQFTAGSAAVQGLFAVTLRHEPDKFAPGVSDGIINNAGGETDIETAFQVSVQ